MHASLPVAHAVHAHHAVDGGLEGLPYELASNTASECFDRAGSPVAYNILSSVPAQRAHCAGIHAH